MNKEQFINFWTQHEDILSFKQREEAVLSDALAIKVFGVIFLELVLMFLFEYCLKNFMIDNQFILASCIFSIVIFVSWITDAYYVKPSLSDKNSYANFKANFLTPNLCIELFKFIIQKISPNDLEKLEQIQNLLEKFQSVSDILQLSRYDLDDFFQINQEVFFELKDNLEAQNLKEELLIKMNIGAQPTREEKFMDLL